MNATRSNLMAAARYEQDCASCLAASDSNVAALEARGIGQGTPVDKFYGLNNNPWEAMPECFAEDAKEDW